MLSIEWVCSARSFHSASTSPSGLVAVGGKVSQSASIVGAILKAVGPSASSFLTYMWSEVSLRITIKSKPASGGPSRRSPHVRMRRETPWRPTRMRPPQSSKERAGSR